MKIPYRADITISVLPGSLRRELAEQLPGVYIPGALARKFSLAAKSLEWFWVFPARQTSTDPECGVKRRHHLHGQVYSDAIKRAARAVGIKKRVTSHALRH